MRTSSISRPVKKLRLSTASISGFTPCGITPGMVFMPICMKASSTLRLLSSPNAVL